MSEVLENIVWQTLVGPHSRFAEGSGPVRRYLRGFSPIVGFEDQANPDLQKLAQYCSVGESFYCEGWTGSEPSGWRIDVDSTMVKMVYLNRTLDPLEPNTLVQLEASHSPMAVELAELTNPGPFGLRTIELGNYYGIFDGNRLVSMAGERFFAGKYREVSGVCTHPDYQGRGLARRLMLEVMKGQIDRDEIPFLHVMSANTVARSLYSKMGFSDYHERSVRVITRTS